MSIKFICGCGKHLRARDEMAARRSVCPRCGAPVGIPSLQPAHPGIYAAPLTPQERRRLHGEPRRDRQGAEQASLPDGHASDIPPKKDRFSRLRRRRHLETHWTQCLLYPLLSWRLLLVLGFVLMVTSVSLVVLIPEMPRFSELSLKGGMPYVVCLLVFLQIVAYTCGTVECALRSALAGEGPGAYWPRWYIGDALKSCLRWMFCLFAGPVVFFAVACGYWLYGGDLTALDWLIVAEVVALAIAYWFLAIVTTNESDRFRDANPVRVGQLIYRLRYRALVPLLVVPTLGGVHSLVGLFALAELQRATLHGWPILLACWYSALFWATFLFRWLGVWCYRNPPRSA